MDHRWGIHDNRATCHLTVRHSTGGAADRQGAAGRSEETTPTEREETVDDEREDGGIERMRSASSCLFAACVCSQATCAPPSIPMLRCSLGRPFAPLLQRAACRGAPLLCWPSRSIASTSPHVRLTRKLRSTAITPRGYVHLRSQETIRLYKEEAKLHALQQEDEALQRADTTEAQRVQSSERVSRARQQFATARAQLRKRHPSHLAQTTWQAISTSGLQSLDDAQQQQQQQHVLEWTCSDTLPSGRAESILRQVCRVRGQFDRVEHILRQFGLQRWTRLWQQHYRGEPEMMPSREVIGGMAEVLTRDAIVLKSAPLLIVSPAQQQMYIDFHVSLRFALQQEAHKLEWLARKTHLLAARPVPASVTPAAASTPVDEAQVDMVLQDLLPADATPDQRADLRQQIITAVQAPVAVQAPTATVPRSAESRRSSNALFFQRLASPASDTARSLLVAPVSAPTASPTSTASTAQLLHQLPAPILAAVQLATLNAFAVRYDVPHQVVRVTLERQDKRLRGRYNHFMQQSQRVVQSGLSPAEYAHACLMQADAGYAAVGGVIDSLAHIACTRQEIQKDDKFMQSTAAAVCRAQRHAHLGTMLLVSGFAEEFAFAPSTSSEPLHSPPPAEVLPAAIDRARPSRTSSPAVPAPSAWSAATSASAMQPPEKHLNEDEGQKDPASDDEATAALQLDDGDDAPSPDVSFPSLCRYAPSPHELKRERDPKVRSSRRFESQVQTFLAHHGVRFVHGESVDQLRGTAAPDLVLLDDVSFDVTYPQLTGPSARRRVPIRWLEMKSMYGASVQYQHPNGTGRALPSPVLRGWLEQAERYRNLLGPGAVVFENGFCDEWLQPMPVSGSAAAHASTVVQERLPEGVIFLDAEQVFAHLRRTRADAKEATSLAEEDTEKDDLEKSVSAPVEASRGKEQTTDVWERKLAAAEAALETKLKEILVELRAEAALHAATTPAAAPQGQRQQAKELMIELQTMKSAMRKQSAESAATVAALRAELEEAKAALRTASEQSKRERERAMKLAADLLRPLQP
jgi:hypothetical protein